MAEIARLNREQEAALQAAADRFVDQYRGDVMKALKAMIVLNGRYQELLEARQTNGGRNGRGQQRPLLF